jgi:hypothetical protein
MTTHEFMKSYISPASYKIEHDVTEYETIKSNPNAKMVKATTFYQIYKHNVFGGEEDRLSMKDFFRVASQYFYYDKYICDHGTEFYYHIIFNEEDRMYILTKDIVDKRVQANRPELLKDLLYKVEAMTKEI